MRSRPRRASQVAEFSLLVLRRCLGVLALALIAAGGCSGGDAGLDDVESVPVHEYLLGTWECTMVSSDPDDPDQGTAEIEITPGAFEAVIHEIGGEVSGSWDLDADVLTVSSNQPGWRTEIVLRDVTPGTSTVRYTPEREMESGVVEVEQRPDALSLSWDVMSITNDVDCARS